MNLLALLLNLIMYVALIYFTFTLFTNFSWITLCGLLALWVAYLLIYDNLL